MASYSTAHVATYSMAHGLLQRLVTVQPMASYATLADIIKGCMFNDIRLLTDSKAISMWDHVTTCIDSPSKIDIAKKNLQLYVTQSPIILRIDMLVLLLALWVTSLMKGLSVLPRDWNSVGN